VISDTDDQPLVISSHLGTYALVTVGRVSNLEEIAAQLMNRRRVHFSAMCGRAVNPTELIAALINLEDTFEDGIRHAQDAIEGSCSLLVLTEGCIYARATNWAARP